MRACFRGRISNDTLTTELFTYYAGSPGIHCLTVPTTRTTPSRAIDRIRVCSTTVYRTTVGSLRLVPKARVEFRTNGERYSSRSPFGRGVRRASRPKTVSPRTPYEDSRLFATILFHNANPFRSPCMHLAAVSPHDSSRAVRSLRYITSYRLSRVRLSVPSRGPPAVFNESRPYESRLTIVAPKSC